MRKSVTLNQHKIQPTILYMHAVNRNIVKLFSAVTLLVSLNASAESGVTDKEILIGQSAAFSGAAAELGKDMNAGAEAYFNKVNAGGGVFGRKIRIKKLDDGYEPDRAAKNTSELIEKDDVFSLFGYIGTPTSLAALPIFTKAKVPFFAPFSGAEALRSPFNRQIFNVRSSYFKETESIVDTLPGKKIAVFYQNDAYGKTGLDGVTIALKKTNRKPISIGTVERNSVDVDAAIAAILPSKPDAIVMIGAYKSCAEFIRKMKKKELGITFWNVSFVGSQALSAELGEDGRGVRISQVVPFPWRNALPVATEHAKLVGKNGNFTTFEGYIAAKIFVEGLHKAGKNLTRESFINGLERAGKIDVGGFDVKFTPDNHNGSDFVDTTVITKDGKFLR
jgi:branched-chain amino acid transport system substrate-binding protein